MPSLKFYYGSGSPYAWRVWLALEHKALAYELKLQSFSAGDLKKPEFRALNPRGRVPVIVDDGFAVYESAAILEYLEDEYPQAGAPLLPATARPRALARRLIREADQYLAHTLERWSSRSCSAHPRSGSRRSLPAHAMPSSSSRAFEQSLRGPWFVESAGAVDFTVYPMIALALRMESKKPDLAIRAALPPGLVGWMRRVEELPFFDSTYPPHWKTA